MKITIKNLAISNFKGIRSLEINFKHITDIFGENAAGKTTIFDAFTWLFFGKDSTDRKDFELKPLDKDGKVIPKVDVEVSAIIDADGKEINIRRVQHEKWVKKRGELNHEFAGNETLYYWNDAPQQQKQFSDKINDLLNENIFKLISNTLYFNTIPWRDRRSILEKIGGQISNADLLEINPDFQKLITLLGDKSLKEFKDEIAIKKRKLKTDLLAIPTRISEVNRSMPEAQDFDITRSLITSKQKDLENIDLALQDQVKALKLIHEGLMQKQNRLHELKSSAGNIKNSVRQKFSDDHQQRKNNIARIETDISTAHSSINNKNFQIENLKKEIQRTDSERSLVGDQWLMENAKQLVFNDNDFNCPACKRPLDDTDIASSKQTLTENFNINKVNRLNILLEKGTGLKTRIEKLRGELQTLNAEFTEFQKTVSDLEPVLNQAKQDHQQITANAETEFNNLLTQDAEYIGVLKSMSDLEEELQQPSQENDNSELKSQRSAIRIELDTLKKQLTDEERISQCKKRIEELEDEEKKLSQQLVDLEGNEFLSEQFTKAKMDTLVSRINGRFKYVTFKLFDIQINGGEVECCDTMINGVPFSDANNAARINAGIDIINTLCEHYNVYAPIFIDNRESVNELIDCNSQVVNLIVSKDKKLRVA